MMKSWTWLFLIPMIVLLPVVCPAAYLIEFKNGATIVTAQYWREGGQIKFYHHGGLVGVSADLVKEVRDTELPVPEESLPEKEELSEEPTIVLASSVDEGDSLDFEEKVQRFQSELTENMKKTAEHADIFNNAKKQNNQAVQDAAWNKVTELRREWASLRKKVTELYDGALPEWWTELNAGN